MATIPTVDFCELAKHSKNYVNQVVSVEVNYVGWWESSYLYGDACNVRPFKIHNGLDCPGKRACAICVPDNETCVNRSEEIWKAFTPYMRKLAGVSRVKGLVVGRLVGPGRYGHLGSFKYEFQIRKVEKASEIPDSVPWPW